MHVYFYAILEKLQVCEYSSAQLVKMIEKTDKVRTVHRRKFIVKHNYFVKNIAVHMHMDTYIHIYMYIHIMLEWLHDFML